MLMRCFILFYFLFIPGLLLAQGNIPYQVPPKALADIFTSDSTTDLRFSNDGQWMLLCSNARYPSVKDISYPTIQLAGLYISTENFAPAIQDVADRLILKNVHTGKELKITGLPATLRADHITWSPDGKKIAFTQTNPGRVDLYVIDIVARKAAKVNKQPLNILIGKAYEWSRNNELVYKTILRPSKEAPLETLAPTGPFVLGNTAKSKYDLIYTNLINSEYDARVFDFYTTTQLVRNNKGAETAIGKPAVYTDFSLSPDHTYIMAFTIQKPFPGMLPYYAFSTSVSILNQRGQTIKKLIQLPAGDKRQKGLPRSFEWRSDQPATITWIQSADTNMQKNQNADVVYALAAPFEADPRALFKTQMALTSITWNSDSVALVFEGNRRGGIQQISWCNLITGACRMLYQQKYSDFNNQVGVPVTYNNRYGCQALLTLDSGKNIVINNIWGNAQSNHAPFLAKFNTATREIDFIWKGSGTNKEAVEKVLDQKLLTVLMRRNDGIADVKYYVRYQGTPSKERLVFQMHHVTPLMDSATSQVINYKRSDGLPLSGTLYLPEGYDVSRDGPLPVFMWSYPRRFYTADEYSPEKATGKKYGLLVQTWESPHMFVTRGYAVFEAGMPVVPDSNENANDTYTEQLIMNAEAAIHKLSEMGVGDSNRVAVGGHSYGASMTAMLLAHTKLFKAGIAMSGDYNRTITPFGYQDETRTYWQARDTYTKMSALNYADRIKTPLLLIHGTEDSGPGTSPRESESLYKAIQGNGGIVRYVSLPHEPHGYRALENILHMVWEVDQWLEKYIKTIQGK